MCRHRLVVRTPGSQPGNRGSTPRSGANLFGGLAERLKALVSKTSGVFPSQVRILHPPPSFKIWWCFLDEIRTLPVGVYPHQSDCGRGHLASAAWLEVGRGNACWLSPKHCHATMELEHRRGDYENNENQTEVLRPDSVRKEDSRSTRWLRFDQSYPSRRANPPRDPYWKFRSEGQRYQTISDL